MRTLPSSPNTSIVIYAQREIVWNVKCIWKLFFLEYCRREAEHSRIYILFFGNIPSTFFFSSCFDIWCPAGKNNLFHFCLSSQGENEGTPSEKWGAQFDSLKIIGLCSIKAQRCSLWSSWLSVYLFICLSIHLFYRRSFASKRAAQTWQRRRIIESNVFASRRRRVPLWSDYLNECSSVVFKESEI